MQQNLVPTPNGPLAFRKTKDSHCVHTVLGASRTILSLLSDSSIVQTRLRYEESTMKSTALMKSLLFLLSLAASAQGHVVVRQQAGISETVMAIEAAHMNDEEKTVKLHAMLGHQHGKDAEAAHQQGQLDALLKSGAFPAKPSPEEQTTKLTHHDPFKVTEQSNQAVGETLSTEQLMEQFLGADSRGSSADEPSKPPKGVDKPTLPPKGTEVSFKGTVNGPSQPPATKKKGPKGSGTSAPTKLPKGKKSKDAAAPSISPAPTGQETGSPTVGTNTVTERTYTV
jgi:hypothetical protein